VPQDAPRFVCTQLHLHRQARESGTHVSVPVSGVPWENKLLAIASFRWEKNETGKFRLGILQKTSMKPLRFLTHFRPAMPFGNRKNILEGLSSSVLSSPLWKPEI